MMLQDREVSFEKSTVEWDGRRMGLVYGIPSDYSPGPTSCIVIAHGAGGPMYSPFISYFHTELAKKGFLTLKFNFPYMEARKRVPDRSNILEESFGKIMDHARSSVFKPKRFFLGGKSMGGRIASQAVANGNARNVEGLFFLGYPLHPPGKTEQLRDQHLYRVECPMLFVSGTRDTFARKELLEKVVSRIGPRAKLHWVEDGDHSLNKGLGKVALADTYREISLLLAGWFESRGSGEPSVAYTP